MSQPGTRNALSHLNLREKLTATRLRDQGKSTTSIANDIHVTEKGTNKSFKLEPFMNTLKNLVLHRRTYA